jgi:hypothetical protein
MEVKLMIRINQAERLSIRIRRSPFKWGKLSTPDVGSPVNAEREGIDDKIVLIRTIIKARVGRYLSLTIISPKIPNVSTSAIPPITCAVPISSKQKYSVS